MSFTILFIEKKEKLYTKIFQPNKNTIDINYILFQMPKQELAEIFWSKREMSYIKAIVW